ncbi:unnamed protein product [Pieris macdunnoughi]|uniref:Uncharacterized protein n=1 Tax=Pieris macdunnoughi TaxID=345717 RepID=A0A821SU74_9NEOP|nr:unnamed protein product [Pieris macdunnoughi]
MLKVGFFILLIVGSCYCLEDLIEDARAMKKGSAKLIGMILLFILSKVAIFKAVSVFVMMAFFQKLFTIAGVFLKHYMKRPAPVYGGPNYDTVGYSYGAPEEQLKEGYFGSDMTSSFDWLLTKSK